MLKRSSPGSSKNANIPSLSIPAKARLTREISRLNTDPPPGVAAYLPDSSDMSKIHAQITGPPDSPFSSGVFLLTVTITSRYPFEPPRCRFITPIYHPNVDAAGRICLDTLKSPPAGSWSPAVSLPSLLLSIRSLMGEPNPDDGLVPEISDLYKRRPGMWREEATKRTLKDATAAAVAEAERILVEGGGEAEKKMAAQDAATVAGVEEKEDVSSEKKNPLDVSGSSRDERSKKKLKSTV
mmetsp:Transcript_44360/g.53602  ORF Transcript_44360/g.53602 Transcript_44360/m.53602 type:complete len:239 (+) Transcript_44360:95-811(+)